MKLITTPEEQYKNSIFTYWNNIQNQIKTIRSHFQDKGWVQVLLKEILEAATKEEMMAFVLRAELTLPERRMFFELIELIHRRAPAELKLVG